MGSFSWEGKKVLVTGGAGFVGSKLCEMLIERGAIVSVADNLERGSKENLGEYLGEIEFHEVDLSCIENCKVVTKGIDVVMNLAAKACGVEYSATHHGEMLTYNALIGLNVLEACRINNVDRVLVVSTSCVYEDAAPVPTVEYHFAHSPERANDGYAWGKIISEKQAEYYHREYGMKVSIARPSNIYGVGDRFDSEKSHVIPAIIDRVLNGEDPLLIWGSGEQSRAFIHRDDVAEAFILLTGGKCFGKPVNVGESQDIKIKDLARKICDIAGISPDFKFDTSKPQGAFRKSVSINRLQDETGYLPKYSLHGGLKEIVDQAKKERGFSD
jgi:nucleoside-diphosphate-sugar epimerase